MNILKNAIDAIECGLEDYKTGDEKRLKSSIRNIHAGILLLFKEKLSQLSQPGTNEVLIKEKSLPKIIGGNIVFVGIGAKTVNTQGINDRFHALGITTDWKRFNEIAKIRNEIEHYYTDKKLAVIQEAIANAFVLVMDFSKRELDIDLIDHMTPDAWGLFVKAKEVYESEHAECKETRKLLKIKSKFITDLVAFARCDDCGSGLIKYQVDGEGQCRVCGKTLDESDIVKSVIENYRRVSAFADANDSDVVEVEHCPECGSYAYIVKEHCCSLCDFSLLNMRCLICDESMTPSNMGDSDKICISCETRADKG